MAAKREGFGPKGKTTSEAARSRVTRSEEYRKARDEYVAIRALRERDQLAACLRERLYELN